MTSKTINNIIKCIGSRYRVNGKVTLGNRWPDEPHAYVVDDLDKQKTLHIAMSDCNSRQITKLDAARIN